MREKQKKGATDALRPVLIVVIAAGDPFVTK
jgi:hypothetical protein